MDKVKKYVNKFGLPRIIITAFLLVLLAATAAYGMNITQSLSDVILRWGMYTILTLAMVPAIQCGIGPNFGISLGIVGGLIGGVVVVEFQITKIPALVAISPSFAKWVGVLIAIGIGVFIAFFVGWLYGLLLNKVKGNEMTVTTYIGFSAIAIMNIVWTVLPVKNGELIYANQGYGVRNTVSLAESFSEVMNKTLAFKIGDLTIPTGLILVVLFVCFLVWVFMHSKTGLAMSAAGSNGIFAKASGINVDKMRITGTILSTVLAATGIVVYASAFGFLQFYNGPMMMGFVSVAAVLLGGATPSRAAIGHVLLGTFLFQGILALGTPVANQILPSLAEVMRLVVQNGMILYALTQVKGGSGRE